MSISSSQSIDSQLLRLPFDQYGRYRMVSEAVTAATSALQRDQLTILDVGGFFREFDGTPRLPAQLFMPKHKVTVLDMPPCDLPGYIQGDGRSLDFSDAAFDLVITCDTLEHVPADDRARFIGELLRVSKLGVILICPMSSPQTVLSEKILFSYILAELDREQPQLLEHSGYGLPQLPLVEQVFAEAGCQTNNYPSGDVYAWLPMMLAKHYLGSRGDDPVLQTGLDELYNSTYGNIDRRSPSYRMMVVAAKDNQNNWLEAVEDALRPTVRSDENSSDERTWLGLSMQLLSMLQIGMSDRREARREAHLQQEIAQLRQQVAHQDRLLVDLAEQNQALHARVGALQDALLWREGLLDEANKRAQWLEGQANDARAHLQAVQSGLVMQILRKFGR